MSAQTLKATRTVMTQEGLMSLCDRLEIKYTNDHGLVRVAPEDIPELVAAAKLDGMEVESHNLSDRNERFDACLENIKGQYGYKTSAGLAGFLRKCGADILFKKVDWAKNPVMHITIQDEALLAQVQQEHGQICGRQAPKMAMTKLIAQRKSTEPLFHLQDGDNEELPKYEDDMPQYEEAVDERTEKWLNLINGIPVGKMITIKKAHIDEVIELRHKFDLKNQCRQANDGSMRMYSTKTE